MLCDVWHLTFTHLSFECDIPFTVDTRTLGFFVQLLFQRETKMINTFHSVIGNTRGQAEHLAPVHKYMASQFFCVGADISIQDVVAMLPSMPDFHVIAVISLNGNYLGLLPLIHILTASPERLVFEFILAQDHYVFASDDGYKASQRLCHSHWNVLPVLNSKHRIIGMLEQNKARQLLNLHKQKRASKPTLNTLRFCQL